MPSSGLMGAVLALTLLETLGGCEAPLAIERARHSRSIAEPPIDGRRSGELPAAIETGTLPHRMEEHVVPDALTPDVPALPRHRPISIAAPPASSGPTSLSRTSSQSAPCTCFSITCAQPIESCGRLWAPVPNWSDEAPRYLP
jgi:hypothetical protein